MIFVRSCIRMADHHMYGCVYHIESSNHINVWRSPVDAHMVTKHNAYARNLENWCLKHSTNIMTCMHDMNENTNCINKWVVHICFSITAEGA